MRSGLTLDERLDRELELLHARIVGGAAGRPGRRAVPRAPAGGGTAARFRPISHRGLQALARLLHSVPAASNASFMRPSAGSNDERHSPSKRSRAGPCQTVLPSAVRTVADDLVDVDPAWS